MGIPGLEKRRMIIFNHFDTTHKCDGQTLDDG